MRRGSRVACAFFHKKLENNHVGHTILKYFWKPFQTWFFSPQFQKKKTEKQDSANSAKNTKNTKNEISKEELKKKQDSAHKYKNKKNRISGRLPLAPSVFFLLF